MFHCIECSRDFHLAPCWIHARTIPDRPSIPLAISSLPEELYFEPADGTAEQNGILLPDHKSVYTRSSIPAQTVFGPVIAPSVHSEFQTDGPPPTAKRFECFQFENDYFCNWMKYVRIAATSEEPNMAVCSRDNDVMFVTTRAIDPGEELKIHFPVDLAAHVQDNAASVFHHTPNITVDSDDVGMEVVTTTTTKSASVEKAAATVSLKNARGLRNDVFLPTSSEAHAEVVVSWVPRKSEIPTNGACAQPDEYRGAGLPLDTDFEEENADERYPPVDLHCSEEFSGRRLRLSTRISAVKSLNSCSTAAGRSFASTHSAGFSGNFANSFPCSSSNTFLPSSEGQSSNEPEKIHQERNFDASNGYADYDSDATETCSTSSANSYVSCRDAVVVDSDADDVVDQTEDHQTGDEQSPADNSLNLLEEAMAKADSQVKRGRGRPKKQVSLDTEIVIQNPFKRPRGRPRKSETVDNEIIIDTPIKRGRGRPPGTRNTPKLPRSLMDDEMIVENPFKRPRGRPPGSTKKPPKLPSYTSIVKRPRGRPRKHPRLADNDGITAVNSEDTAGEISGEIVEHMILDGDSSENALVDNSYGEIACTESGIGENGADDVDGAGNYGENEPTSSAPISGMASGNVDASIADPVMENDTLNVSSDRGDFISSKTITRRSKRAIKPTTNRIVVKLPNPERRQTRTQTRLLEALEAKKLRAKQKYYKNRKYYYKKSTTAKTSNVQLGRTYKKSKSMKKKKPKPNAQYMGTEREKLREDYEAFLYRYQCPACPLRFYSTRLLSFHRYQHGTELENGDAAPVKCIDCNHKCENQAELAKHVDEHGVILDDNAAVIRSDPEHADHPHCYFHPCSNVDCRRWFCTEFLLKQHRLVHCAGLPVPSDSLVCSQCNYVATDSVNLAEHITGHGVRAGDPQCICSVGGCNAPFRSSNSHTTPSMVEHTRASHPEHFKKISLDFPYQCTRCFLRYPSELVLKRHQCTKRVLQCYMCAKRFKKKKELLEHVEKQHVKDSKYPCPSCDFLSVSYKSILIHIKKNHDVSQLHVCEVCQKIIKNRFQMKWHMKTHTQTLNYLCDSCGKRFNTSKYLRQHVKYMHGTEMRVKIKEKLLAKQSRGEVPSRNSRKDLALEDYPYRCEECRVGFLRPGPHARHMHEKHPPY
ncbi:uncharacterized protein LOC129584856 [Paramacrobiotus metropolitanus]|uniref:uncharacterized protein LOC129584856 n=1 Tax=Paramacrobiotus metropolitanus TaxID=2943436 RepID=UPI0024465032|nr:uncharacterized protein LOC129584856 [Paramacrobiotus metropolitanus]